MALAPEDYVPDWRTGSSFTDRTRDCNAVVDKLTRKSIMPSTVEFAIGRVAIQTLGIARSCCERRSIRDSVHGSTWCSHRRAGDEGTISTVHAFSVKHAEQDVGNTDVHWEQVKVVQGQHDQLGGLQRPRRFISLDVAEVFIL